jgi:NAD(P)H dehydrogenase (quinone)
MAAGDARLPFISRDDLAFAAATAVVADPCESRAWRLGGAQLLGFADIARLVSDRLRTPVRYEPISDDENAEELRALAMAPELVARRIAYVRAMRQGFMSDLTDDFKRLTGRQPVPAGDVIAAMDLASERPLH